MWAVPTSRTCFQTLRIPGHFKNYETFKNALEASMVLECTDCMWSLMMHFVTMFYISFFLYVSTIALNDLVTSGKSVCCRTVPPV